MEMIKVRWLVYETIVKTTAPDKVKRARKTLLRAVAIRKNDHSELNSAEKMGRRVF